MNRIKKIFLIILTCIILLMMMVKIVDFFSFYYTDKKDAYVLEIKNETGKNIENVNFIALETYGFDNMKNIYNDVKISNGKRQKIVFSSNDMPAHSNELWLYFRDSEDNITAALINACWEVPSKNRSTLWIKMDGERYKFQSKVLFEGMHTRDMEYTNELIEAIASKGDEEPGF